VDLPAGKRSGLIEAERVLPNLDGIEFIYFTEKDVVRHKLVQMIIKAYDEHSRNAKCRQSAAKYADFRPSKCHRRDLEVAVTVLLLPSA